MPSTQSERVLFARIGWMRFYAGSVPGDERPIRGGGYNRHDIGSELYNFRRRGRWLYGYFETVMHTRRVNLQRIDPSASAHALNAVLVIFVSTHAERGQVVVGWYDNAKVYQEPRPRPFPDGDREYRCVAEVDDSVLLPESARVFEIPTGLGGMGEANVCYALESDGSPKPARWIRNAIGYVRDYSGDNLLTNPLADAQHEITAEAERALGRSQGIGVADARERKALEEYGVRKAMAHFARLGFGVENVGAKASYDVCCTKHGRTLCVEVKTTTTTGDQVILTPREAEMKGNRALFVVHSVKLHRGKPRGGSTRVILPWRVSRARLKPISYMYKVPKE